ncbi:MAG: ABC transporter permease subunit [Anaerolineales bacterium]|jgi:ABC-2 type transport system permease protein
MRNIWTIAKREYRLYFNTPMAYMVAFLFLLILGFLFYSNLLGAAFQQIAPGVQVVIGPMVTLLLFATPAITMRLLSAEQSEGTIELLLTAPVRDWELVIGKWLGGLLFMITLMVVTWVFPLVLNQLVDPGIDQGPLITGYMGLILMSSALIAIGVAISSLFSNQNAAFFATLGVFLLLWLIGIPSEASGSLGNEVIRYLDFRSHFFDSLFRGVINLSDILYYLSLTALALFLGSISIGTRRWR